MSRLLTVDCVPDVMMSSGTLTSECSTPRKRVKLSRAYAGENLSKGVSNPFRNLTNTLSSRSEKTPPKARQQCSTDPATPTTNIKMLMDVAANLEYVGRDPKRNSSINGVFASAEKKSEEKSDGTNEIYSETVSSKTNRNQISINGDFALAEKESEEKRHEANKIYSEIASSKTNRKQRSLSFICDRFLSSFPEYPDENANLVVSIDTAATSLGVERRRMYDIVNVLESVEIVKKTAKNKYRYYGKKNLLPCLRALSIRAREENVKQQLENITKPNQGYASESANENFTPTTRERTLGGTSQKFLMLFLASTESYSISLQVAAQVLMGKFRREDEAVQFKTKIRRLYDIANIFISVGLIEKDRQYGSKQSFRYIGPSIQDECSHTKDNMNALKYLSPVTSKKVDVKHAVPITSPGSTFIRAKSETWDSMPKNELTQKKFVRHSSLQDICAAAEIERQKLYSSANNITSISHHSSQEVQNFTISPGQDKLSKISHINLVSLKKATPHPAPDVQDLSSSIQRSSPVNTAEVCNLIKDPAADQLTSKVENSEAKPDLEKVISLTSEQGKNILKFLDVSLKDGQTATILIGGGNNTVSQRTSPQMSMPSGCTLQGSADSKHFNSKPEALHNTSANCSNTVICDKELIDSDSNTSYSFLNDFSVLTTNSVGTPNDVSPISIPSGYATPSVSRIGDPTFLPNQEVAEVLKTMEKSNTEFQFTLSSKKANTCNNSHLENFSFKNKSLDSKAPLHKARENDLTFLHENSTNSSDSTNEEIQVIMQKKHESSVSTQKFDGCGDDKVFLLDEKTIYSPITIQDNLCKSPYETSVEQKQCFKQLPTTLPAHMLYSTDAATDKVLLVPVCSPSFSNVITCLQYPVQTVKCPSTVTPFHVSSGHSSKTLPSAFSPVCIRPVFKQPRKIVARKLNVINVDTLP